ncbi:MAG: biotin--[acetyl-CoA-carboxylase] ligase, partial [Oscillospiraceae bacterium]
FPPELSEIATSLQEKLDGVIVSRSKLIGEILNEMSIIIDDLENKNFLKECKARSFILGSEINVIFPTVTQKATAIDFNEFGHLIVKLEDGEIKTLSSGEISIRKI